jgi:CRISPR-associated endonuclease/helicase Cas3
MVESYPEFFRLVTGSEILPYQSRYGRDPFSSQLIIVPTGLGKTDSVLLPWLYARKYRDQKAPTRLIIVLPRQNLTAQTAKNARTRVASAGLDGVVVLELMAGSEDKDKTLRPNQPAIIVCTQDMYFSRALNRGYARRPPRWPIDFALYNQDCLVVLDEIQLMEDALATSRQLASFRDSFQIYGNAPCVWMSATVNTDWLQTVDAMDLPPLVRLEAEDLAHPLVMKRYFAKKRIGQAPSECRDPKRCAAFTIAQHRAGTRTLVIANTVPRAREIFATVRAQFPDAVLIHSRFRPRDRGIAAAALQGDIPDHGQIIVSTQVLEAGVDITARLLITDVAPWGSLVQRFGRVNRYGDDAEAEIWWVDQPTYAKQKGPNLTAPYSSEEIVRALSTVQRLASGAPADLPPEAGPEPWQHVLRRADLLDLFDTTPDLSGNELDVSRFIRATEEKDAYLGWRSWGGESGPPESIPDLTDEELCPVPLGELREFMRKHSVYTWNFATEQWTQEKEQLYAGMIALTHLKEGGYTAKEGWSPESRARVQPVGELSGGDSTEGDSSDPKSYQSYRQTLSSHTERVVEKMESLLGWANLNPDVAESLRTAAALHDWGKAHPVFQKTLHKGDDSADLLAKQCRSAAGGHERKHFRHELASALAMLATGHSDLSAYLVAAHHGRVRLGIRSMPGEAEPDGIRTARGIRDRDVLPACEIAPGLTLPSVPLALALMDLGAEGGSWTDRMLRLRDELGPFRLAYLEMLLRMADEEASSQPGLEALPCR